MSRTYHTNESYLELVSGCLDVFQYKGYEVRQQRRTSPVPENRKFRRKRWHLYLYGEFTGEHFKTDREAMSFIDKHDYDPNKIGPIVRQYQSWRKDNGGGEPNRVAVRMHWEDDRWKSLEDTIAFVPQEEIGFTEETADDEHILFYVSSLNGLLELTRPNNGSDFVVEKAVTFYRA